MIGYLFTLTIIIGLSLVTKQLLLNLRPSHRLIFLCGTFVVVAIGAYAASFVLDMVMLAWAGDLPLCKIVWPSITWSVISIGALFVGTGRAFTPAAIRILPFAIFGGLGMATAIVHPKNIAPALILILGGVMYAWSPGIAGESPQRMAIGVPRQSLPSSFDIGGYRIDTQVSASQKLVELTPKEYKIFARMFKNEKTYYAPPATFLGRSWNIMLGTVGGHVWKVAAFVEIENIAEAKRITDAAMRYCISTLGEPAEQQSGITTWDTRDGNVILQTATVMGTEAINLFVTSRSAGSFELIR